MATGGGFYQYLEMDRILEYDTKTGQTTNVLVDNFRTSTTAHTSGKASNGTNNIQIASTGIQSNGIRVGMTVSCFNPNGDNYWTNPLYALHFIHEEAVATVVEVNVGGNYIRVAVTNHFDSSAWTEDGKGGDITFPIGAQLVFEADKVLNFDEDRLITGINIIDDVLFFTDNENEPKKVHIERSKSGSLAGGNNHTLLFSNGILQDGSGNTQETYVKEKHITVIKKSPLFPPTLQLSNTTRGDGTSVVNTVSNFHPIYSATTISATPTIIDCSTYTGTFDVGGSDFGFLYNPSTGTGYVIDDDPLVLNPVITILVPANDNYEYILGDRLILSANSVSNGLAKTHEVRALVKNNPGTTTPLSTTTLPHVCFASRT